MRFLCADPGLAHFGWAILEPTGPGSVRALAGGVFMTKKSDKKLNVRASADLSRRTQELTVHLLREVEKWEPQAATVEAMSHPRQASAAAKLSRAWGVLDAVLAFEGLPSAEASPQAIKEALCGRRSATKIEVEGEVRRRVDGLRVLLDRLPKTKREHLADAAGSFFGCRDSQVVRMALKMGRRAA